MSLPKAGLFVYGTLRPDRAPDEIRDVVRKFKRLGSASIKGTVYDLGDYPGLVLKGNGKVQGILFSLPDDPEALARLDAYEEYLPNDPERSLFVRRKSTITLPDGRKERHWVYLYNQSSHALETVAAK